jgi:aldehyde dehydrogenase (NAD+)
VSITLSFIGGEPVASRDHYDNIDPATGRSIGAVARGGADEIGGFKRSGYGREKEYEALDTFTATKTVVVHL